MPPSGPQVAPRFIVGIDLGTTNSAVAFIDTSSVAARAEVFPIPQIVAPGEVGQRNTLPSFCYHAGPGEFDREALRLPWGAAEPPEFTVGGFARDRGTEVPGRLIGSAKSWLCHTGVDRTAGLLPWHGAPDVPRICPAEASARYLEHIRAAWNHTHPEHPLERQDVIVTIPASFDEIARELTVAAARRAGLPRVILLEEPQAAFYSWVQDPGNAETRILRPGQQILVCDIGGGTSDFTLIEVRPGSGKRVRFHRIAVGDHLILGGDNLDLALAHFVEHRLGVSLEARQWSVLVRRCRDAKESLLGADAPERLTLNIPAMGARLIGGARQVEISREEVAALLLEGFLPRVRMEERPAKRASGFQEFGLPYAPDSAITRYLAAFLAAHHAGAPEFVLFNGGLFKAPLLRRRLLEVLASWFGKAPTVLENDRLDLAVALGAAYYGAARRGTGTRISGGLARAYYVGVRHGEESAAVCLAPAGLEEGRYVDLDREFALLVRQPAEFPLFASSVRTADRAGDLVRIDATELAALPPISTALRSRDGKHGGVIRVRLHAKLTEIGTLEVSCSEADGPRKWKLPFDVRATAQTDLDDQGPTARGETAGFFDDATVQSGREAIREAFLSTTAPESIESPAQHPSHSAAASLVKRLEQITGCARFDWPPSLLRSFWEELLEVQSGRTLTATHEARWLNLTGFSLRPGYGFAVDDWRVAQTWRLFEQRIAHKRNELCRAEWWILWRRIAGGLSAGQQRVIAEPLLAGLRKRRGHEGSLDWGAHETAEIWRLLASLELLAPAVRASLGEHLLAQLTGAGGLSPNVAVWALGRLGARVPMHGPINTIVPAETAERWARRLLEIGAAPALQNTAPQEDLRFAVVQLVRRTGDRYRDISADFREQVLDWLQRSNAPPHHFKLVRDGGTLHEEDQDRIFGETLPHGLQTVPATPRKGDIPGQGA